jgi:tetratricopeptide (TPR) repeat protein
MVAPAHPHRHIALLAPMAGLLALLLLAWLAYLPGLSGNFLFDDFVNLDALGNGGKIDNWATFWRYVTSGTADPTGRPLALLSFLIDARDWPALPGPFLRTNVLLHLLNGALLFALLRKLGDALDPDDTHNNGAALLAAGLWLLHPLLVSTTLYVVQREAMLPATFTLLGLLAYAHGRIRFARSDGAAGGAWMFAGIGVGTLLAVLSKGNGLLLPLLGWVLEASVFSRLPGNSLGSSARLRRIRWLLLILPSLLVFAYLATFLPTLGQASAVRSWTAGQRLLTEPRVLLDYLRLLLIPRSISSGLYNDAYVVSQGLLRPITTLPAILAVAGLIFAAIHWRRRAPALAAGVLFFFAGNLFESSLINLELYFEHRNYLPAMLLFWPLSRALWRWQVSTVLRASISIAALLLFALITYQRTTLWGQPEKMAALWAMQGHDSSRAQAAAAIADTNAGRIRQALERLAPLWNQHPYDLQIAFNFIDARCRAKGPSAIEKAALSQALRHTKKSELLTNEWLGAAIGVAARGECQGLTIEDVEAWIHAALENPVINNAHIRSQDIEPLLGEIAIQKHSPDEALMHFNRALLAYPSPDTAARQAALLASADYYEQALAHLDAYERIKSEVGKPGMGMPLLHAKVLEWQGYWPHEMAVLRGKLHAAIAERDHPR